MTESMPKAPRPKWELRFTTRIGLLFGALSLLALGATMAWSLRTAQVGLDAEIENSLQQHHRSLESLLETRLNLLDVYLQSASANRIFADLVETEQMDFEQFASELAFLFQDSAMGAQLDIMFLLDLQNRLMIDAGLPLYNIAPFLQELRSPIAYTNHWRVAETPELTMLVRAVPIFDPATIRLRGYLFVGLALGENRSFINFLADRSDVNQLSFDLGESAINSFGNGLLPEGRLSDLQGGEVVHANGHYFMRSPLVIDELDDTIWVTVGLAENRFTSLFDNYWRIFLLLSGGFLLLLFLAAMLLNLNHSKAINNLMRFIHAIQTGRRDARYEPGGVFEYNQVGFAMQDMVEDLNIAATVFESADGMVVTDASQTILRVNHAFLEMTGYQPEGVIGQPLSMIELYDQDNSLQDEIAHELASEYSWQGEVWSRRRNGEPFPLWATVTAVMSSSGHTITNYVATMIDISESREAERRIEQLAFYDQLTGLPNRQLLRERLEQAMLGSAESEQYGALIYIDLDDFKTVNDTRGHELGDQLLKDISSRLSECVKRNDTVSRIGGDEFCLILEDLGSSDTAALQQAEWIVNLILKAINRPLSIEGIEHFVHASLGITLFQGDTIPLDDLLQQAELAMYQAKQEARNGRRFFNPRMQARVLEYVALASDMRKGLDSGEFVPFYQPQVDGEGKVVGFELLIRWHHSRKGVITPADFIPVAEENGLIIQLGNQVLDMAGAQLAKWARSPELSALSLAVNISARQLHQPDFVEEVSRVLRRYQINASLLKLELTESMLLEDVDESIHKMRRLRSLGVRFSLDDFGTGYSSLSYLKRLPLDQLKIDKSFVRDLLTDPYDADIARTIVSLARGLGLEVIAEGVETREQRDCLAGYGCEAYQGYFFGRPVPIEDLDANNLVIDSRGQGQSGS
ncbi:MAG: EAL domain-containing protein [Natronospirillum sp.]|uniref:EAL domain-containing protein n=1 Tax=Natronospirillum sp. TaxID=2812955 RepID=UPI0025D6ACD1|nr:EAL domain-containing protein [Natronospirillum sp.]MCH8550642.1 EAL domain-containing protein [Natronospirillum sp.]